MTITTNGSPTADGAAPVAPGFRDFSLDDRYSREEGQIYLTGIQALVRLPRDQHLADRRRGLRTGTFISGYRGSPLGGYDLELSRQQRLLDECQIVHQPGLNEELAATAVYGSQLANTQPNPRYDGVLGIWYGKGPGVDRTADVFRHANFAGINPTGGVIALGGDDPSCKSSTIPSGSEAAFFDVFLPTLYPGNVQEILDLGLHGFALSRASGLWTGMKIVTNVADSAGTAEVSPDRIRPVLPAVELDGKPYQPRLDPRLLPPYSLELERTLHYGRLELARRYAAANGLNQIVVPSPGAWFGMLTAGKSYYDVRQALRELGLDDDALAHYGIRILKMGMLWPLESGIVREFAQGLEEILVVEEKRAFLETHTRDVLYGAPDRPAIVGKSDEAGRPLLQIQSDLDADKIARAIAARLSRKLTIPSVEARIAALDARQQPAVVLRTALPTAAPASAPTDPARTAYYCSGCPHNRSNQMPEGSVYGAGIGCHSLGMLMDPAIFGTATAITQMGGEGAQWIGMSHFTNAPHLFQNVGDGTFFHSGTLALNFAVAAGVNMTYKILYNSAVAMTGGQSAVGELPIPRLAERLAVEGVKQIIITSDNLAQYSGTTLPDIAEVWHRDRLIEAQERLAAVPGVTVLIHDGQCATEKRRLRKRGKLVDPPTRIYINERVCEGCGDCGKKSNCLSVVPVATEFGRKTQIHQGSCNKDYSCLLGDCPSFLTVTPRGTAKPKRPPLREPDGSLPEPALKVPDDRYALRMMGIGGTGVVTVSQILGTAATIAGYQVYILDQTGLAQKGGAVVSDLKLAREPMDEAKISAGGADLYLGFDLLVANEAQNLTTADPSRTIAVISTAKIPTGAMVTHTNVGYPATDRLLSKIERATRSADNCYFDAQVLSEALFGDHMPANFILIGTAYQAGALPIDASAIEQAIRLNGVAVQANLAAFRWGRTYVIDPEQVNAVITGMQRAEAGASPLSPEVAVLIDATGATGELRRLLEIRVPDLIAYQDAEYATRYAGFVKLVGEAEQRVVPGNTVLAETVARNLYKLLAYKDEYEVARLHLDAAEEAALAETFGDDVDVVWKLHPPLLRELGMQQKLSLGAWFRPGMKTLRAMKRLRGTRFDPFGQTEVRRTERALSSEYRQLIRMALERLTPENHSQVVALADLPDLVRGYEQIKLDNVAHYREAVRRVLTRLSAPNGAVHHAENGHNLA